MGSNQFKERDKRVDEIIKNIRNEVNTIREKNYNNYQHKIQYKHKIPTFIKLK